jgi:serine protease
VAAVEVAPASQTLVSLGATVQFTATARDASGRPVTGKSFSWQSTTPAVATVSTSGLATAVTNGNTTIRATVEGVTGSATITVAQEVASISIAGLTDTLRALGATAQLTATPKDAGGATVANQTVAWSSSDDLVVTVTSGGLVTAVGNGGASVTAATAGKSALLNVAVRQSGSALALTTEPAGAVAGEPLATQPVLEIRDSRGNVVVRDSTTVVTAAIASGGGTLAGTTTATAVGGVATFADLAIQGVVGNRTLAFTATSMIPDTSQALTLAAGPASVLVLSGGDGQSGPAATALASPLAVKVSDAYTNGIAGVTVGWTVAVGTGSVSAVSVQTNASGVAQVTYTLGAHAGTDSVEANASGLAGSPVVFETTATPNGTISGVVTVTNALLTPPAVAAADATMAKPGPTPVRPSGLGSKQMPFATSAASAAPRAPVSQSGPEFVPDELIVTFRAQPLGAPPAGAAAMASPATAQAVGRAIRSAMAAHEQGGRMSVRGVSPAILAARVKVTDPAQLGLVMSELRAAAAVATVERNPIVRVSRSRYDRMAAPPPVLPNDPYYAFQAWNYAMIDAPRAWDITTGSSSVLVAVVDDGIRFDHPGIAANLSNDGYDFVTDLPVPICGGGTWGNAGDGDGPDPDPTNPMDVIMDPLFDCISALKSSGNHGLHVAGTIGAVGNDGVGGSGVNWHVRVRPVRVLGLAGGTNYDIAQGILYAAGLPADNGAGGTVQAPSAAPIINLSLGGAGSTAMQNAVVAASGAGSLLIAAAGNDGVSTPMYPAAYPEVLSVSGVGPDAVLASYSNYGSTVDIAAPGGDLADGNASFGIVSTVWDFTTNTPNWDSWQGTSMAAPHVSGVAALILAANPGLSAANLRARLVNYAVDVGAAGRDDYYGAGIVNARNSLTQTMAPPRNLYVRLFDATTGRPLRQVQAAPAGAYEFTALDDGTYAVFAGQDEDGDAQTGIPLRRWGSAGGTVTPNAFTVDGAGTYPATFDIGLPVEQEPNDVLAQNHFMPIGGYVVGTIAGSLTDADVVTVPIWTQGTYTFETRPGSGACGFALEEDTILQLYDGQGNLIAENDDINSGALNFCSRISRTLDPGVYYLVVWGWNGLARYTVMAR